MTDLAPRPKLAPRRGEQSRNPAKSARPSPPPLGGRGEQTGASTKSPNTKTTSSSPLTTNHEWKGRAACKGLPINLFYPDKFDTASPNHANPANAARETVKQMCQGCPVRVACLVAAVAEGEADAVRAGLEFGRTVERRWAQTLTATALRVGNGRIDERQAMEILSRIDNPPRKVNR